MTFSLWHFAISERWAGTVLATEVAHVAPGRCHPGRQSKPTQNKNETSSTVPSETNHFYLMIQFKIEDSSDKRHVIWYSVVPFGQLCVGVSKRFVFGCRGIGPTTFAGSHIDARVGKRPFDNWTERNFGLLRFFAKA